MCRPPQKLVILIHTTLLYTTLELHYISFGLRKTNLRQLQRGLNMPRMLVTWALAGRQLLFCAQVAASAGALPLSSERRSLHPRCRPYPPPCISCSLRPSHNVFVFASSSPRSSEVSGLNTPGTPNTGPWQRAPSSVGSRFSVRRFMTGSRMHSFKRASGMEDDDQDSNLFFDRVYCANPQV